MTTKQYDLSPDNIARMITMVFGKMGNGQPFWCFIAIKPSCIDEVSTRVKNKTLDLTSYVDDGFGEIIVSGEGLMPPPDVVRVVAQMSNVPLRQMFQHFDMDEVIKREVDTLKKHLGIE